MGNTITLKHGETVPTTNDLIPFELGYCTADGALYINNGSQIKSIFQSNGAISTVLSNNLTASRVLISDTNGKIAVSDITSAELNSLEGITDNIQAQLANYYNTTTSRIKNTVLAAPNGTNGAAVFRELVENDLPIIPVSKGGTGATNAATARSNLGITVENIGAAPVDHAHKNSGLAPYCIEFTGANETNNTHGGYIDFHYKGSTEDYTSRIKEISPGVVTLNDKAISTEGHTHNTLLWSGTTNLSSNALTITNGYSSDYTMYVFVWSMYLGSGSDFHFVSQTMPRASLSTTDIVVPFVSGNNYKYMNIKYSGNDLVLSINATGGSGGYLCYVYGIK